MPAPESISGAAFRMGGGIAFAVTEWYTALYGQGVYKISARRSQEENDMEEGRHSL